MIWMTHDDKKVYLRLNDAQGPTIPLSLDEAEDFMERLHLLTVRMRMRQEKAKEAHHEIPTET